MGTLTADMPCLPEHCPHKLATSCRLTSIANCCACADDRPHSRSYSVYIDGVGFVQRGTRWQSYCWFCKEFWNNRIACTDPPLAFAQSRIPHLPDQSEFIMRWNEFHQGYRIVKAGDGTESRIAVVGEPFKDVSPGYLPRTLHELRMGQQNDATRVSNIITRAPTSEETSRILEPHRTIEEELDSLLLDDTADEGNVVGLIQIEHMYRDRPQQARRRAQQRRDTERNERIARVWGTREDIESEEYTSPITNMFTRTMEWHRRRLELVNNQVSQSPETVANPDAPDPTQRMPEYVVVLASDATDRLEGDLRQAINHLDNDERPEPKTEADKMVKLECQICYQQIASIACVPCGHLVMCEWCADIEMPVRHRNVPAAPSKCPMCRKKVSHRVKIHIG